MKILFIGGTGTISMAISQKLLREGKELYLLNRGNRNSELEGAKYIVADINDEKDVSEKIKNLSFDVVADFIAYTPDNVERDYRLFAGKTKQYIFISSTSAYQKPPVSHIFTESTPLYNPYWKYSDDKIKCEEFLIEKYREEQFPITIVRPSHTYDNRKLPIGFHGDIGSWQTVKRMIEGKEVIIPGDGTSIWTLTHNTDFAKGVVGLMGNVHAIGEAFHITSDELLTWNQIHQIIADAVGVKLKAFHIATDTLIKHSKYDLLGSIIGDKANSAIFDNSKLKRYVPDYVATKRFDQGVKEAVEYILAHEELQEDDKEFDEFCDKMIEKVKSL